MIEVGNFLPGFSEVQRKKISSSLPPSAALLLVAMGAGWSLWWPSGEWASLTPDEQTAVINSQRALLDAGRDGGGE